MRNSSTSRRARERRASRRAGWSLLELAVVGALTPFVAGLVVQTLLLLFHTDRRMREGVEESLAWSLAAATIRDDALAARGATLGDNAASLDFEMDDANVVRYEVREGWLIRSSRHAEQTFNAALFRLNKRQAAFGIDDSTLPRRIRVHLAQPEQAAPLDRLTLEAPIGSRHLWEGATRP